MFFDISFRAVYTAQVLNIEECEMTVIKRESISFESELRTLVKNEIREQVTSNTTEQSFQLVWARRPFTFVETETDKLLLECWEFFPSWKKAFDLTSSRGTLSAQWEKGDATERLGIARALKKAFYQSRGLYTR